MHFFCQWLLPFLHLFSLNEFLAAPMTLCVAVWHLSASWTFWNYTPHVVRYEQQFLRWVIFIHLPPFDSLLFLLFCMLFILFCLLFPAPKPVASFAFRINVDIVRLSAAMISILYSSAEKVSFFASNTILMLHCFFGRSVTRDFSRGWQPPFSFLAKSFFPIINRPEYNFWPILSLNISFLPLLVSEEVVQISYPT